MKCVARDAHLTYPHASGFAAGGARLLATRHEAGRGDCAILDIGWTEDEPRVTTVWEFEPVALVWPSVAADTERVAWVHREALHLGELTTGSEVIIFAAPGLQNLCSLSADGSYVIIMQHHPNGVRCLRVDANTGRSDELFDHPWFANHPALVPYDESWLAYSHEGPAAEIRDRVWVRNRGRSRSVFDRTGLAIGHERWMFHDLGAVVCVYGESPIGPRGVYQIHPDGRRPRLVCRLDRAWHCDISRDGRCIVIDTSGPVDAPGRGWQDAGQTSDVVLIDTSSGSRRTIASTRADRHPRHPHPVFSPDGRSVLFNHSDPNTGAVAIVAVPTIPGSPQHTESSHASF